MDKKLMISFILGVLITSTISYAAYKYQASDVGYTPSNSEFKVDNVNDAIKELYEKVSTNVVVKLGEASSSSADVLQVPWTIKSSSIDGTIVDEKIKIEYGTDENYGKSVECTSSPCTLIGLNASTKYYYKVTPIVTIVTNGKDSTGNGITNEACIKICSNKSMSGWSATYELDVDSCTCKIKTCAFGSDSSYRTWFCTVGSNVCRSDLCPTCTACGGDLPESY